MTHPQLDLAYRYAQYTHRNIFLTGKAGTGKTTFLRQLKDKTHKRMIVVAPTGVAAINAGGVTIHSFFQLAPGLFLPGITLYNKQETQHKYSYSKHKINILRSIDLLVIDEISMVRADLLDAIDDVLRRYQSRSLPFGGVQLLMIGDLQQLSPVTTEAEWQILKEHYNTPYFFSSKALQKTNYTTIELTQVFRQSDADFVSLLNQVRVNQISPEALRMLNARYMPSFSPSEKEGYITLTTHNYQAQEINRRKLETLPTQEQTYTARIEGDFPQLSYPTDLDLTLKVGAQVMFCKNDPSAEKQYYNGKIGRVVRLTSNSVTVSCQKEATEELTLDEQLIEVSAQEWTNAKYVTNEKTGEITEEIVGKYIQIPLKTAWAITIHKSQGLTFDKAIINAGGAFSHGQVYVALSRCRTLEGIVLSTPITPGAVMSDPHVVSYNRFIEENQPDHAQLAQDERQYIEDVLCEIFDFERLDMRLRYLVRLVEEHLSRLYPHYVERLKTAAKEEETALLEVGKTFHRQIAQLIRLHEDFADNEHLHQRIHKAIVYFTRHTAEILGEWIEEGLPDIDNKQTREQMEKEFDLLKSDYDLKMLLFIKNARGFSLKNYWDAKAQITMQQSEGKPSSGKRRKGETTERKSRKKDENKKELTSLSSDIKHPILYDRLRNWRKEKAAEHGVPPYTILKSVSLIGIVNLLPSTGKELMSISGIGKKVITAFGKELLEIIDEYRERLMN